VLYALKKRGKVLILLFLKVEQNKMNDKHGKDLTQIRQKYFELTFS